MFTKLQDVVEVFTSPDALTIKTHVGATHSWYLKPRSSVKFLPSISCALAVLLPFRLCLSHTHTLSPPVHTTPTLNITMASSDPVPNKTLVYKRVPEGMIRPNVDMVIEDRPVALAPPPRGMIVKTLVVGFDPHQRDRMKGPTFQSYVPGYVHDEPMNTFAVAKVLKSDNEKFQDGDIVAGILPISEYGVIPEQVSFSCARGRPGEESPASRS